MSSVFAFSIITFFTSFISPVHMFPGVFDVSYYGAIGDGITDDSKAFVDAWKDACRYVAFGLVPTVLLPPGGTFLLNPVNFQGPCMSDVIHVQLLGSIVAPSRLEAWDGHDRRNWIAFSSVDGLVIDGSTFATIDGRGSVWWDYCNVGDNCEHPVALRVRNCSNVMLRGLQMVNSGKAHIGIERSRGIVVWRLAVNSPSDSPNTDGIDISSSSDIVIREASFRTGDDCISINGGSSNINISYVTCGPGHGISVGSLGEKGHYETVERVHVLNCFFYGATNGVRIKTWQGGSGYARHILFENMIMNSVRNPIIIDQYYCIDHNCVNKTSAVEVSDIRYRNVHGTTSSGNGITLSCSGAYGCRDIVLENVNIVSSDPEKDVSSYCLNAHGRSAEVTPEVPCLLDAPGYPSRRRR